MIAKSWKSAEIQTPPIEIWDAFTFSRLEQRWKKEDKNKHSEIIKNWKKAKRMK